MVCQTERPDEPKLVISIVEKPEHDPNADGGAAEARRPKSRLRALVEPGIVAPAETADERRRRRRRMARAARNTADLFFMVPCLTFFLLVAIALVSHHAIRSQWAPAAGEEDTAMARIERMVLCMLYLLLVLLIFTAYTFYWAVCDRLLAYRREPGEKAFCCCSC